MSIEQMKNTIHLDKEDEKQNMIIQDLSELSKNIPKDHAFAVTKNEKGDYQAIDLGSFSDSIAAAVYEENQGDTPTLEIQGADHVVKYESIINLLNSEPSINQALNLKSELPVAYGFFFRYPPETGRQSSKLKRTDVQLWSYWASYVNFDHVLRQTIHSLYATGNVWIEKVYDTAGLNRGGWGIKRLRVLSPDVMYNVVDEKGNIIKFFQWAGGSNREFQNKAVKKNLQTSRIVRTKDLTAVEEEIGKEMVIFERHQIIYANYNAYYDDTVYGFGSVVPLLSYARSKIGIQKRVLRMIENSASSFVVFKYGTEQYMISGNVANKVMKQIGRKKNPKFMAVPFYFDVEVIEMGQSMQNIEPYLNFFRQEQMYGIGLPLVISMPGSSGEGAEVQLEVMVRQMKYMQNFLSNLFKKYLFPEVNFGESWIQGEMENENYKYGDIPLSRWAILPELKWRQIESVSDQRLRHEVYASQGILGESEIREEIGYFDQVEEGDVVLPLRLELRSINMQERNIDMQKEIADADREMNREVQKEQNEISRIQAKKSNTSTNGGSN